MSTSASFSLLELCTSFGHNIRPQILMSAQNEKRSCYGISLVLTEKAEQSKQGSLGPWRCWSQGGRAAEGLRVTLGTSTCSHTATEQGSLNTKPECWAPAGFLWRHAIVLHEFFVLAACFCWPAAGRVGQCHSPDTGAGASGGGSLGHWGCVGSERSGPQGLRQGRRWHVTG